MRWEGKYVRDGNGEMGRDRNGTVEIGMEGWMN